MKLVVVKSKGLDLLAICLISVSVLCEKCCGILLELLETGTDTNVRYIAMDLQDMLC